MSTIVAATSPAVTAHRRAQRTPRARRALAPKVLRVRMALAVPRAPAVPVAQVAPVAAVRAASIRAAVAARPQPAEGYGRRPDG